MFYQNINSLSICVLKYVSINIIKITIQTTHIHIFMFDLICLYFGNVKYVPFLKRVCEWYIF